MAITPGVQDAIMSLRRQRAAEVRKVELYDEAIAALTAYQEQEAKWRR